jgi:tetratricopeptide (TPR) repeat protein
LILPLLAAAAAAAAPATSTGCPDLVTPDALVCRAVAADKAGDSLAAAQAFEEAAKAAGDKDPKAGRMWAAAGNMWIASNQPAKAAADLDKALASGGLEGVQRGEALLDRARAAEEQGDYATARARLTEARRTISADPFYWLFSAALAIREGDHGTSQSAITRALSLAPNDASVLFEAGHVALFNGEEEQARSYWRRAQDSDPNGPIGRSAAKAIEVLGVTPTVKTGATPPAAAQPRS